MLTIESALSVLKKFGYESKDSFPYIYKNNNDIGINYSYSDSKYGITDRIITFNNIYEMELFLKKYQWYKLNGKKYDVKLKLNNYEISTPEVLYIRDNHVMSNDEILNIEGYEKNKRRNEKLNHTNKLLLEAEKLMNYYYLEKSNKEKYTNNYFKKENELNKYLYELQLLINEYNKKKQSVELITNNKKFNSSLLMESQINELLAEFKEKTDEVKVYKLINSIWNLNKDLELNTNYMYALRHNDDIDEELRKTITKIDYMKELLSKKKSIFKPINLKEVFNNIDNQSTYESMYDDNFTKKYESFINKKYNVLDQINEFKLYDYLNNFKRNKEYDIEKNINRCKKEDSNKLEYVSIETANKELTKQYNNNLSLDEQNALILYVSIYRELFDMIQNINNFDKLSINELYNLLKITDNYTNLIDYCYKKVKEVLTIELKETIFNNIDFSSEKAFIESLLFILKIIFNINDKMILKHNIKLYFKVDNFDKIDENKIITTSSIIAPLMNYSNNRVIYAKVLKGVNVLFSPKYLTINQNNIEIVENINSEILLDTKDIKINKDENMITYSRFKSHFVDSLDYKYIDKYEINYKININKVVIEKRINNE